jgi:hypothetical protein
VVKVLTLVAALTLAGCQTTKGSFCEISSPIRLSSEAIKALSDQEVRTLLAHNRKGEKLCGWKP